MKIKISAESTIDLPKELLEKYDISTIPFGIQFGDKLEEDTFGIAEKIFKYVDEHKVLPKTSSINPAQYTEYFTKLRKESDAVIHICVSSMMSSAYNNAVAAAKNLDNVFVVDSKTLCTGIAILAIFAKNLCDKGLDAGDVYKQTVAQVSKVRVEFILDKIHYMHKGGRCGFLTLFGANLLKIKPHIYTNGESGKMTLGRKYRGLLSKVCENFCDDSLRLAGDVDKSLAFITHSTKLPEIQKMLYDKLKAFGFKQIYDTDAGGTISAHCGPDCIGFVYMVK